MEVLRGRRESLGTRLGRSVGRSVCRSVSLSVCRCVCPYVFTRTVADVDTKCGYVGMCNGLSAQQESGAASSTACLRRGPKIIYSYYTRCALIRDRRPTAWTAWDGFAHPAEREAMCIIRKVSLQIVVEISKSLCYVCQVRGSFCERSKKSVIVLLARLSSKIRV